MKVKYIFIRVWGEDDKECLGQLQKAADDLTGRSRGYSTFGSVCMNQKVGFYSVISDTKEAFNELTGNATAIKEGK